MQRNREIILGGGCFWGVSELFRRLEGVVFCESGYCQGNKSNVTYEEVCSNKYGFIEVCRIGYDVEKVSLETILELFYTVIDPLAVDRQGNDVGHQYQSGIFVSNIDDYNFCLQFLSRHMPNNILLEYVHNYCRAEEYHQDYLVKNPNGYCHIDFSVLNKVK